MAEQKVVRITYKSHYPDAEELTTRDIELLEKDAEYCYAFCRLRQDFRTFRLDRIKKAELRDESFQPRPLPLTRIIGPAKRSAILALFSQATRRGRWIWWGIGLVALLLWLLSR
jgi:predicted DNA-binding transcriptional regulator YafY